MERSDVFCYVTAVEFSDVVSYRLLFLNSVLDHQRAELGCSELCFLSVLEAVDDSEEALWHELSQVLDEDVDVLGVTLSEQVW